MTRILFALTLIALLRVAAFASSGGAHPDFTPVVGNWTFTYTSTNNATIAPMQLTLTVDGFIANQTGTTPKISGKFFYNSGILNNVGDLAVYNDAGNSVALYTFTGTVTGNMLTGTFSVTFYADGTVNQTGTDSGTVSGVRTSGGGGGGAHGMGPKIISGPSFTPKQPIEGVPLTFTASATATDGGAVTYAWQFGDGTTGDGIPVTHVYTESGTYTVTLTVTDTTAASSTATLRVVIPGATFVAAESLNRAVVFTGKGKSKIPVVADAGKFKISAAIPVPEETLSALDFNSTFSIQFGDLLQTTAFDNTSYAIGGTSLNFYVQPITMKVLPGKSKEPEDVNYSLDWSSKKNLKIKISGGCFHQLLPSTTQFLGATLFATRAIGSPTSTEFISGNFPCDIQLDRFTKNLSIGVLATVNTGVIVEKKGLTFAGSKASVAGANVKKK